MILNEQVYSVELFSTKFGALHFMVSESGSVLRAKEKRTLGTCERVEVV